MSKATLILCLAVLCGGCVGALAGATFGGAQGLEWAAIDVTAVSDAPGHPPIVGATVDADCLTDPDRPLAPTDAHGMTTVYVRWPGDRRQQHVDDAGEFRDVVLTVRASGYLTWQSVVRVRPGRFLQVRATLVGR